MHDTHDSLCIHASRARTSKLSRYCVWIYMYSYDSPLSAKVFNVVVIAIQNEFLCQQSIILHTLLYY